MLDVVSFKHGTVSLDVFLFFSFLAKHLCKNGKVCKLTLGKGCSTYGTVKSKKSGLVYSPLTKSSLITWVSAGKAEKQLVRINAISGCRRSWHRQDALHCIRSGHSAFCTSPIESLRCYLS